MKKLALSLALVAFAVGALAENQGDGAMQRLQPPGPYADMKKLDRNGDGFISREEAAGHPRLQKEFAGIDRNGDGRLSPEELRSFRMARSHDEDRPRAPHAGAAFKRLDTDHDGLLSRDEVRRRPEIAKRFDLIDRNHDQRLSRDEMRAARKILREHKS